jgi:antitoxin component YwqK of YwqJK toxin-antitoxin module
MYFVKLSLILSISILIGDSCSSKLEKSIGLMNSIEYDSQGRIIGQGAMIEYNGKTVNHNQWTFYEYVSDDTIKTIIPFYYGKMEGVSKEFDSEGKLRKETEFHNNLKDGNEIIYRSNGAIDAVWIWQKGYNSSSSSYYCNGRLKLINIYDFNREVIYVKHLDSLGVIKLEESAEVGNQLHVFSGEYFRKSNSDLVRLKHDSLPLHEQISGMISVVETSDTYCKIAITIVDSNGIIISNPIVEIDRSLALFKFALRKSGKYNLHFSCRRFSIKHDFLKETTRSWTINSSSRG